MIIAVDTLQMGFVDFVSFYQKERALLYYTLTYIVGYTVSKCVYILCGILRMEVQTGLTSKINPNLGEAILVPS